MIGDILQPTHLIFILVVALLVLGPKRLPEVGRSLGRGLRDFKGALTGDDDDRAEAVPSQTTAQSTPAAPAPAPAPVVHDAAPVPSPEPTSAPADGPVPEPVHEPAPEPVQHTG